MVLVEFRENDLNSTQTISQPLKVYFLTAFNSEFSFDINKF